MRYPFPRRQPNNFFLDIHQTDLNVPQESVLPVKRTDVYQFVALCRYTVVYYYAVSRNYLGRSCPEAHTIGGPFVPKVLHPPSPATRTEGHSEYGRKTGLRRSCDQNYAGSPFVLEYVGLGILCCARILHSPTSQSTSLQPAETYILL